MASNQTNFTSQVAPRVCFIELPNEIILMICDCVPSWNYRLFSQMGNGDNQRRFLASLRQTCRKMNVLLSEAFFKKHLSEQYITLDRKGLERIEKSIEFGIVEHIEHIRVVTNGMLDWPLAFRSIEEQHPPWSSEFLQIFQHNSWGKTINSCLRYFVNVKRITIEPPRSPWDVDVIGRLRSRFAFVVDQFLPLALIVIPTIQVIHVKSM